MIKVSQYVQQFNSVENKKNVKQSRFQSLPVLAFKGKSSQDTFVKTGYTTLEANNEVFTDQIKRSLNAFIKEMKDGKLKNNKVFKALGEGCQGTVYDLPGTNAVVKLSYTKPREDKTIFLNCDFENESRMLKRIPLKGTKNQKLIARLKLDDGVYALVTSKVNGKPLCERDLQKEVIKSLLDEMFILDKARIMHCDLKDDNILVEKGTVGIVDYGASFEFDHFAEPYNVKYGDDFYQYPVFWPPANARFFDFHTIYSIYNDIAKHETLDGQARQFFTDYLKERSHYHQKRADLFSEELKKCVDKKLLDSKRANYLKKSVQYEQLQAKIFKEPSEKFVNLELEKISIDVHAHHALIAKFKGRPISTLIATKKELRAISDFKDSIKSIYKSNDLSEDEKDYLRFQKRYADFYEFDVSKPSFRNQLTEYLGEESVDNRTVDMVLNLLSKDNTKSLNNKLVQSIVQKTLSLIGSITPQQNKELTRLLQN